MMPSIEAWNRAASTWAGLAWAVSWQSAALVGLFALVAAGLRRSSPGFRYWLWQVAAIKLLVMPLWTVAILLPAIPRADVDAGVPAPTVARPSAELGEAPAGRFPAIGRGLSAEATSSGSGGGWPRIGSVDWRAWLMLGWGLGIACQVVAIVRQRDRLNRLLRRATPADGPTLLDLVAELSGRIGLRKPPEVLLVDGVGSPFVCGLRRAVLVLPIGLGGSLAPGPLRAVLLHELAHIRRRDLFWDWIPTIARVVYWFHPAAHHVADRARLERELACDQAAMVLAGQDAAGYASILVDVVGRASETLGIGSHRIPRERHGDCPDFPRHLPSIDGSS